MSSLFTRFYSRCDLTGFKTYVDVDNKVCSMYCRCVLKSIIPVNTFLGSLKIWLAR